MKGEMREWNQLYPREVQLFTKVVNQRNTLAQLLLEFVDEDPFCRYDHYGYCQVHGLSPRPCKMERARLLLTDLGYRIGGGEMQRRRHNESGNLD